MIYHFDGKVCGGLLALPPLLGWGEYNIMDNGIRLVLIMIEGVKVLNRGGRGLSSNSCLKKPIPSLSARIHFLLCPRCTGERAGQRFRT